MIEVLNTSLLYVFAAFLLAFIWQGIRLLLVSMGQKKAIMLINDTEAFIAKRAASGKPLSSEETKFLRSLEELMVRPDGGIVFLISSLAFLTGAAKRSKHERPDFSAHPDKFSLRFFWVMAYSGPVCFLVAHFVWAKLHLCAHLERGKKDLSQIFEEKIAHKAVAIAS